MAMSQYSFYADGACLGNPGPGGWGVVATLGSHEVLEAAGHSPHTTNNQMELEAILQGMTFSLTHLSSNSALKKSKPTLIVLTDSKYAVQGINQWLHNWSRNGWVTQEGRPIANLTEWKRLHALLPDVRTMFTLEMRLVPGHQGILGNERADKLATEYARGSQIPLFSGTKEAFEKKFGGKLEIAEAGIKKLKVPAYYLSYVNGKISRHKTWPECEAEVKGKAGAKYKKVFSESEEADLLKQWGAA